METNRTKRDLENAGVRPLSEIADEIREIAECLGEPYAGNVAKELRVCADEIEAVGKGQRPVLHHAGFNPANPLVVPGHFAETTVDADGNVNIKKPNGEPWK
jgi:hypothetical protein